MSETSAQKKVAAILLCLFLGGIGAHRFYLKKVGSGIGMLALTLVGGLILAAGAAVAVYGAVEHGTMTGLGGLLFAVPLLGAAGIWALIDLIRLLTGSLRDKAGLPLRE